MNPLTYDVDSPARPVSQRGDPTWEVTLFFPRQGDWTEDDYLSLGTNWMVEFSEGMLEVLPMPTTAHQVMVEWLYAHLKTYVDAHGMPGRVLFAPLPIRLWAGKYREPDVVYLNPQQLTEPSGQPRGAEFVAEVVSEGTDNRRRDLEVNRRNSQLQVSRNIGSLTHCKSNCQCSFWMAAPTVSTECSSAGKWPRQFCFRNFPCR